jgi:hypothetical protein
MAGHFRVISNEWRARSRELADGTTGQPTRCLGPVHCAQRKEQLENKRKYKALTLPKKSMRGQDMVTLEKLARHFSSTRRNHLIGLRTTSPENTCRWFAIDIDLHEVVAVDADDRPDGTSAPRLRGGKSS